MAMLKMPPLNDVDELEANEGRGIFNAWGGLVVLGRGALDEFFREEVMAPEEPSSGTLLVRTTQIRVINYYYR